MSESGNGRSALRWPIVTFAAIGTSVVVFFGHMAEAHPWEWETLKRWGVLNGWSIYDGGYYALLTSVFVHAGYLHLAFNLYWLWVLGRALEGVFGPLRYLAFFVGAAWVSSACELAVADNTGVGLSGVGYALFGFTWVARPVYPVFRRVVDHRVVSLFLIWLLVCFAVTAVGIWNVANAAHVGGLLFGALLGAAKLPRYRRLATLGATTLSVAATVTLFWAPWSATYSCVRGVREDDAGDHARALEWFTRAIEIDPGFAWAHARRGWDRARLGDYEGAIADYTRSFEIDRNDHTSLNLAAWYLATAPAPKARNPARAVELARRLVLMRDDNRDYVNTLGVALYRAGQWREALETLEQAMSLSDGGTVVDWLFGAMAHFQLGETVEAGKWHAKAVAWMQVHEEATGSELRRFRAEADALMAPGR